MTITVYGTRCHGIPEAPATCSKSSQRRNSTLPMDARQLATETRVFLDEHPEYTAQRLSVDAGLRQGYAGRILRGEAMEVTAAKGKQLLAAMAAVRRRTTETR